MTLAAIDISTSFQQGLDSLIGFLPRLLGFLAILIIGYFIAKAVKAAIAKVLEKVGLDRQLHSGQTGQYVERVSPDASPSNLIAAIVFWLIFIFVLSAAIGQLRIPAVTTFMNDVLAYLPNVIVAVLIFILAGAVAGAVGALVAKTMGDTPTGKIVGTVFPALVMTIAVFMILEQLQIAPEIVRIAFGATMLALALGLALAFGLGGRDVAKRMLEDAYQKGQEQRGQVKQDLQTGRDRGEQQAQEAKAQAQQRVEGGADDSQQTQTQAPGGAYRQS